ncbi:hypothetical protein SAMN02745216_02351 [Desulfatibacillum alkenivorans DSM 16219]|uniref:Curli production assembly/transport component CsgG n=1 Tax=Desulfatibacillum alkenivorans DSM 16219 TaxID=1121393 RepID=A0A1M6MG41_9BACT|nr:hypothetical protein [Desulfatibacillum alkenivorans]SHJ82424.1 hypothetical protein SAMN02745216_02351 [Desulfatibacillum alkenivorans DSM 16219]
MKRILLALIISMIVAGCTSTSTKPASKAEDITIYAPSMEGFEEVTKKHPALREHFEMMLIDGDMELLGGYILKKDLDAYKTGASIALDPSMMLQVFSGPDKNNISREAFAQSVKQVKEQFLATEKLNREALSKRMEAVDEDMSNKYGVQLSSEDRGTKFLGIAVDQSNAVGVVILSEMSVEIDDRVENVTMVVGSLLMHIKNNGVIGYISKEFSTQENVEWVKSACREWADFILKANGETGLESTGAAIGPVHSVQEAPESQPLTPVKIGKTTINIPAPQGLYEVVQDYPQVKRQFSVMVSKRNRLLAGFASGDDLRDAQAGMTCYLDRYMSVQTPKRGQGKLLSSSEFSKIRKASKELFSQLAADESGIMEKSMKELEDNISREYGASTFVKPGQPLYLGTIIDEPNAYGIMMLTKIQAEVEGETMEYEVVDGIVMAHVKGKMVSGYIYATYESSTDVDWVKEKSLEWTDLILKANGEKGLDY